MKWNNIKTTIFKELRGIFRDQKSLRKLILYPLLIPAMILLFGFLFDVLNESSYTVGINYKLSEEEKVILKDYENIKLKEYKDSKSLEKAYNNKDISGYIVKENNNYVIYVDEAQNSGEVIESITSSYLEQYNKTLGKKKILENGLDPDNIFNSITIETKSLTEDKSNIMTNIVLSLVITYLIMIVVLVCIVVVTDATSGEKERGTLETILTFPVKSGELVLGKYIATTVLGFAVGLFSYLLAIPTIIIGKEIFKSYKDIVFSTSIISISLVVFIILLSALLSAGVCMVLAGKAKTYKEAQSSLQSVSFLAMIPYFLRIMETNSSIFYLIPIANCGSLLNDIILDTLNIQPLLTVIFSTIVYIVVILVYISKQYNKEETLFS